MHAEIVIEYEYAQSLRGRAIEVLFVSLSNQERQTLSNGMEWINHAPVIYKPAWNSFYMRVCNEDHVAAVGLFSGLSANRNGGDMTPSPFIKI
ncbi:predicted protein [Sclerotinia sclerotiorum 1980 UF-70]|uniref:Uncharacterized protein n=1 Tax=Sclerotinia sclerotiorum (strain ATCC 18683 / 1980 / Ss-1) TaxID=665079 RepID=A7F6U0_SCLS1|nr:predicted protein [Sclerotinia sclerotiorum 1980 UF-70]EDN98461.1 predicted protein [Sclerotinia sclerotiorum 1980 UF-70]